MGERRNSLISWTWDGGRDRTRTCDLLRVKENHPLRGLHPFSPVPNIYNNLGNLRFARTQPKRPHQIEVTVMTQLKSRCFPCRELPPPKQVRNSCEGGLYSARPPAPGSCSPDGSADVYRGG